MKVKTSVHLEIGLKKHNFGTFVITFWLRSWPKLEKMPKLAKPL